MGQLILLTSGMAIILIYGSRLSIGIFLSEALGDLRVKADIIRFYKKHPLQKSNYSIKKIFYKTKKLLIFFINYVT